MKIENLVPIDFIIPENLENEHFKLRILSPKYAVKDYEAIIESIDHLQNVFGSDSNWPTKDLTLEKNRTDLEWHKKEFENRSSFAYTVLTLDEAKTIGSLYIDPTNKESYDVRVDMWVRMSMLNEGLDAILFNSVKQWISEEWPFKKVAYPGRELTWRQWEAL